ncbi:hypothetical protein FRC02_000385 [Tulasnella sp. 418]|nr:hypothetical protein FRC02_000385 [Tulasnella sp. 418]
MVIVKQPSSDSAQDPFQDPVDKAAFPSTFRSTNRQSTSSSLPPPAYDLPLPPDPEPSPEPKKRIRKKLKITLVVVLCLYIAVTTVLLVLLWTGRLSRPRRPPPRPGIGVIKQYLPPFTRPEGAPETDGYGDTCNQWTFNPMFEHAQDHPEPKGPGKKPDPMGGPMGGPKPDFVDHLSYYLSPNTSLTSLTKLFVRTDGVGDTSGTFTVISDDSTKIPMVEVQMKYRRVEVQNVTNVCLMRSGDRVGLGIYSTESVQEPPVFDIILHVPGNGTIDELVTELPSFTQNIGQNNRFMKTVFGLLQLQGSFSPIYVRGSNVNSRRVKATTSFSVIYGKFTTSESLILRTSEAAIDVNVTLVRESSQQQPVILQMSTENAIVRTVITLAAAPGTLIKNQTLPDFYIQATSANAPVAVDISHQDDSEPSKVEVDVSTESAPAVVSMDPKYEGTFRLYSDLPAELMSDQNAMDPEGLGRMREIEVDEQNSESLMGHVQWRSPGKPISLRQGSVNITTKAARAKLYLEDKCFWSCTSNDGDSRGSRRMPLR